MTLYETIFRRKSNRSYDMTPLPQDTLDDILRFWDTLAPLMPDCKASLAFTDKQHINCIQPWRAPHYAVIYTNDAPFFYENIGFMGQMLDLYLQSHGIGCCWLGMGSLDDGAGSLPKQLDNGLQFGMMLAFGLPKDGDPFRTADGFKRNTLAEIADTPDERLEVVRLAPSAINSQPWYFVHDGDVLHLYRIRHNAVLQKRIDRFNRMDIGIALAHLSLAFPETYTLLGEQPHSEVKGYDYMLSLKI